jgi:DNA-binding SARP family transcriptional activator/tetratricopeptide (TPR) repeat protein
MTTYTRAVTIDLLGGFAVHVNGAVIHDTAWPGRRSMELVQLLALADRHQLIRDQVLEDLWPHLDPSAGAANLRKAAHHARQTLGDPDAVVLRGGVVALFPGHDVVTDLERFEHAAAQALAHGDADECASVAETWPGELLPGSLYEEWTQQHRTRAHTLQLSLVRAAGRWSDVVELEPTDEAAYQHLIESALATGARSDAIRWYGRLRSVFARELGVAPSHASQVLYERCLEGLTASTPELIGRSAELAVAEAALRMAVDGRGGAIAVRGAAGIGKSTLAREIASMGERKGWWVRQVATVDAEQSYAPVIDLIDDVVLNDQPRLDTIAAHARSVLAALTPIAGPADPLAGPLSRHQIIGAVVQLLRAASDGRPILVFVDDAHAADDATLEVLVHTASSVRGVLVLLAYRDAPSRPALEHGVARLARAGRLHVIELGPLDRSDATRLVAAVASRELPSRTQEQIVDLAEGNPFAIGELARAADPRRPDALAATVSDAITSRLVDLDPATVSVLQRIALASGDLDSATAVALTGGTESDAFATLDRALDAGILVVAEGRYRFRHDLVRQALVERVAPHQRLDIHRDAAQRLSALGASPAVIARHWLDGGRPADAVPWLLAAAIDAMRLGAFADARAHLAPLLLHDPMHPQARRLNAEALDMMGDPAAVAAYDAAIEAASDVDVDDLVAMRALAQLKQGDPPGALAAIKGATPTSVIGRLSEALTYAGAAALGFADPALGSAKAAESRRIALQSGDTAAIVIASWAQAAAAHSRGELHESVLADLRDTKDLPHLAIRVFDGHLCITQRFLYGARPYADVIAFADALADEGARLGAARGHAFGVTLRGEAELLSGRLDDAEADLVEGGRLHRAIAGATGEALALQRLAELAIQRGQTDRAAALLAEALDLARVTDIGFHLLDRIYGTRIVLAGDPDGALAAVDEAEHAVRGPLETCPGCRITFAVPAAVACARAGQIDRAIEYEKATEFLAHVVMRLPAWNAAHEEVRGHVALAAGDTPGAHAHFSAAADQFGSAGHPFDHERCVRLARSS